MWVIPIFDNKETDRGLEFCQICNYRHHSYLMCMQTCKLQTNVNPHLLIVVICDAVEEIDITDLYFTISFHTVQTGGFLQMLKKEQAIDRGSILLSVMLTVCT